jgi:hypothetical protein
LAILWNRFLSAILPGNKKGAPEEALILTIA